MKGLFMLIVFLIGYFGSAQESFDLQTVLEYQIELNEHYSNPQKSPLKKEDLEKFTGLPFFEPNEKFFIKARFVRTPNEKPFEMPTTTERKPLYVKYGEIHFTFEEKECSLDVFQNVEFSKSPLYKNSLFLPFTDYTSGVSSYGGGRYLDINIPEGDVIYLDFNKAYNPYCAYNYKYSCPIPPEQNDLPIEIKAGVKYEARN